MREEVPLPLPFQAEARSVTHLRKLNSGLEIKIIELQQKLTQQVGHLGNIHF